MFGDRISGMGKALYRKYRSKSLGEVVGQEHVTEILAAALKQGRVGHAYLFTGPRGVGKTSVARILAHEIGGVEYTEEEATHLDIIEIDAASNNSVDDVRNLRERVAIAPTSCKKKIYIIDEVHMLSKPAFNALLKTLEEPPEHVVFIMATTDAHKLPATIVSRSQQFVFRLASQEDIVKHLRFIAGEEGILISDEALELIARKGGGSFRDSISLLDQIASVGGEEEVSREMIERALGLAADDVVLELISEYRTGDVKKVVRKLKELGDTGVKPEVVAEQIIQVVLGQAGEKPELLSLADKLVEVARSSYPEVKLLTILTEKAQGDEYKVVAAVAEDVKTDLIEVPVTRSSTGKPVELVKTTREDKCIAGHKPEAADIKSEKVTKKTKKKVRQEDLKKFDWQEVLAEVKGRHMSFYSLLSKCEIATTDEKLVIYAKSKFYRDRLDCAKCKQILHEELEKTHAGGLTLEILAEGKPVSEGVAADIAVIMGGGEEVKINE